MSHRLGSNINSPIFISDTPSQGNNKTSGNNIPLNSAFFSKGDIPDKATKAGGADKPNDTYEHIGGQDDVFVIRSQGGAFQLHRKTLKDTLIELKTQSHIPFNKLNPEYKESFSSIVEALRLLYGSQALYDLILTDIREAFSDVKEVKPGTVAAFFIGCFTDDKFPGPVGCSPKCAASLPPTEGTPGYANCDDYVLMYSGGVFTALNEKRSSHAWIYVDDINFPGFSVENIRQLKDSGIENASIIFGKNDGTYGEMLAALTLDNLPRRNESGAIKAANDVSATSNGTTSSNSGAGVVFAIIVIAIIILLIIILYRTYNPR